MSLSVKTNVVSNTNAYVTLIDATGNYNAVSNPGGFGAPNPTTGDIYPTTVVVVLKRLLDTLSETKTLSFADLQAGVLQLTSETLYQDGVWEIETWYQQNITRNVTWVPGTYKVELANADTLLSGIKGVLTNIPGYENVPLLIDETKTIDATGFYVTTVLAGSGTGVFRLAYKAQSYMLVKTSSDECIAKKLGRNALKLTGLCGCSMEVMDLFNRIEVAKIFFSVENYDTAHELIDSVRLICESNCGC